MNQTAYETQVNLSLLYQQLVHHWRNTKHTENTLVYLLKSIGITRNAFLIFAIGYSQELFCFSTRKFDCVIGEIGIRSWATLETYPVCRDYLGV